MGAVDYLTLRVKGEDYFRIPLEKKVTVIRAINNEHCSMVNYLFQRLKDKASISKGISVETVPSRGVSVLSDMDEPVDGTFDEGEVVILPEWVFTTIDFYESSLFSNIKDSKKKFVICTNEPIYFDYKDCMLLKLSEVSMVEIGRGAEMYMSSHVWYTYKSAPVMTYPTVVTFTREDFYWADGRYSNNEVVLLFNSKNRAVLEGQMSDLLNKTKGEVIAVLHGDFPVDFVEYFCNLKKCWWDLGIMLSIQFKDMEDVI